VLSVTVVDLRLRAGYGVVSSRHGRGGLPGEMPDPRSPGPVSLLCTVEDGPDGLSGSLPAGPGDLRRVRFPLAPFLGTTGVAVAGGTRPHSVPPGQHGGNLDVSVLGVGSTLHLPVQVPGALAYVGDPHFSQGDGEVALTAFEAPLRALLRLDLVRQGDAHGAADAAASAPGPTDAPAPASAPGPTGPWAETEELLVAIGLDADLGEAMRDATRCALALLEREGMHRAHAYAYLSAAGDFAVSQVVDQVCGVHGTIRKADLRELRGPSGPSQA
jgi:acetamidase/formamidase